MHKLHEDPSCSPRIVARLVAKGRWKMEMHQDYGLR